MRRTLSLGASIAFSLVLLGAGFEPSPLTAQPEQESGTGIEFSEHLIMDDYTYPHGIAAQDLDGDGDLDLTSADAGGHDKLYWFENDGSGSFKRHLIQEKDPERLERHRIGDIDGDGDPDVAIVKNKYGDLLWFENSGTPADGRVWQRHIITRGGLPGAYDVELVDLDEDGDLDAAGSAWRLGNQFAWFENDGTPAQGEWAKHLIEVDVGETRTIRAADFDGDGDPDLLGTSRTANQVMWYENPGAPASSPWIKHVIEATQAPIHGEPADMDGDGDLDVVMALGAWGALHLGDQVKSTREDRPQFTHSYNHHVVWYENDGVHLNGWSRHLIADDLNEAYEVVAGDLDGDGDMDVAATGFSRPGQVVWYENGGDPRARWTAHQVKNNWKNANQLLLADLDGDGDLDIAANAERGSLEFRWWQNQGRSRAGGKRAKEPARGSGPIRIVPQIAPTQQVGRYFADTVQILPLGRAAGTMKLLRHPDGTLYLHTQSVDLARVLAKSTDGGRSWQAAAVRLQADVARDQHATAFTISSDGRLWLVHQAPTGKWRDWGLSVSEDGGQSWVTRTVHNWPNFAPTAPGDPYERAMIAGTHPCFLVRPDDTLMLVLGLGHDDSRDYVMYEKTRSHNVMVRSRDGGRTWGEPSIVHQHGAEGDYALDPNDPDHILGVFRKQQPLLVGEDRETVEKEVGLWGTRYSGTPYPWKGSILLESTDAGRSFREVPESYLGFYSHRGSILWTPRNVVIVTHQVGYYHDRIPRLPEMGARISLDGGKTWVDGTDSGTPFMNRSTRFKQIIGSATAELEPDRFFTAYSVMAEPSGNRSLGSVEGFFWSLKRGKD